ncbi:MAG TPA: hypothetical protein VKR59_08785 [Terriglobales bacterium]|nr:hypothetical protein [Terriglobales bacterium]
MSRIIDSRIIDRSSGAIRTPRTILPLALLVSFITASPLFAQDSQHATHAPTAKLIQDVREATKQFLDVNAAVAAGYGPAFGCVSGPDHGAMGIHYVNGALVGAGLIDVAHPQALIYEPVGEKRRLVGVEYIVDAATWLKNNNNTPPSLDGQDFQFVPAPNRFNLADFFELHVWAWRNNPEGAFVDWNNHVTCEGQ